MKKNRLIDVKKQANLSVQETFRLCLNGIAHRLTRSVLTLAVVVLAVAFFMFLLCENAFVSSTATGVDQEIQTRRLAAGSIAHLYNIPLSLSFSRGLANAARRNDTPALMERAAVTGYSLADIKNLADLCRTEQLYLDFFENMAVGKLVVLAQNRRGREILRYLSEETHRVTFEQRIRPMLDIKVPAGLNTLFAFATDYPLFETKLEHCRQAWSATVEELIIETQTLTGGKEVQLWLAETTPEQLQQWVELLHRHGFRMDTVTALRIQEQLQHDQLRKNIITTLSSPENRELWRKVFRERRRIAPDEMLLQLDDERATEVLGAGYSAAQLKQIAKTEAEHLRLMRHERTLAGMVDSKDQPGTISGRQWFLLFISFLVCMVGITNAMLMSITERFKEIATMKCLGATDHFILVQFMLEAALQGVAGGIFGMLLGFSAAIIKASALFGNAAFTYWPGWILAGAGVFSIITGIILSILASIYPSWAASRMAPMEAMRVE